MPQARASALLSPLAALTELVSTHTSQRDSAHPAFTELLRHAEEMQGVLVDVQRGAGLVTQDAADMALRGMEISQMDFPVTAAGTRSPTLYDAVATDLGLFVAALKSPEVEVGSLGAAGRAFTPPSANPRIQFNGAPLNARRAGLLEPHFQALSQFANAKATAKELQHPAITELIRHVDEMRAVLDDVSRGTQAFTPEEAQRRLDALKISQRDFAIGGTSTAVRPELHQAIARDLEALVHVLGAPRSSTQALGRGMHGYESAAVSQPGQNLVQAAEAASALRDVQEAGAMLGLQPRTGRELAFTDLVGKLQALQAQLLAGEDVAFTLRGLQISLEHDFKVDVFAPPSDETRSRNAIANTLSRLLASVKA